MNGKEYPMQAIAPTVAALLQIPQPAAAQAAPITEIVAENPPAQRVAVFVTDALGCAVHTHWHDMMPHFSTLLTKRSVRLRSILPSKTPVNFACMVTGADMGTHGIRQRSDTFACETLFDSLRKAGKTSAGIGRNGYTGHELLGRAADYSTEGRPETDAEAEPIMRQLIVEHLPDFVIVQFALTDDIFHTYGPYAPEAGAAAAEADRWLARWTPILELNQYTTLILADHGQHTLNPPVDGIRGGHGDECDEDCLVPCTWIS